MDNRETKMEIIDPNPLTNSLQHPNTKLAPLVFLRNWKISHLLNKIK